MTRQLHSRPRCPLTPCAAILTRPPHWLLLLHAACPPGATATPTQHNTTTTAILRSKLPLMVAGTQPGVSLLEGVLCEVVLGIVINQMFLLAAAPPPPGAASIYPQRLSLATILATLIPVNLVGARFTGPCLNPIVAFAWYWHFSEKLALREHLLLFWLGPFAGAVLSGPLYNWATGTKRGAPGTKAKQRTSSRLRKAD